MINISAWKEYQMSQVEREFLDDHLVVQKQKTDPDLPDDEFFARFCIAQILKPKDLDVDELAYGYTGGDYDGGIDGVYFFVAGKIVTDDAEPSDFQDYEGLTMSLIIIQATRSPHFTAEQIRKFEDTSKDLLDLRKDVDNKPGQYNVDVRNAIRRFRNWWQALKMKLPTLTIEFHVASKGDELHPNITSRSEELKSVIKGLYPCECQVEFHNAKMLLEMARKSRRDPVELKFVKQLASDHWGNAYVCLVKVGDYVQLLTTPSGQRREYILEPNVRGYLGSKGVNAAIHSTLTAGSETEEFWWLNNGVTITSSKVTPGISSLILKDARIVNGLQTSREIFNYSQLKSKAALADERHILVKVIEADRKVARHITKTTNSQSKIDPIYLRTTSDDVHDNIESAMPNFGFHYERVKNQYYDDETIVRTKIITLGYLTRALIAVLLQEPGQARGGPGKFVARHYNKIFNRNSKPELFGHTAQLMKRVEAFVVSNISTRNDQTNLKYYVAMDAVCALAKRHHIQRATITRMKTDKLTDELLKKSLDRVKAIYDQLIREGVGPDLAAKGGELTARLKRKLMGVYALNGRTSR